MTVPVVRTTPLPLTGDEYRSSGTASLAGRRILLLNWRDSAHPRAGGAEVYCEEMGARFAAAGAEVTLFTARPAGASATAQRHGVTIIREGTELGVYARAARFLRRTAGAYDVVVDFQNGIPFFAPLFVGRSTAVVCVIHHVHQEQFALHYPWPASRVGQMLEGPTSRRVYGRRPVVAVSPSTRHDVRRRLGLRGPIHVIPNGMNGPTAQLHPRHRSAVPKIAVVSRLVSHKRFDKLLEAVPQLLQHWPDLTVDIAGDGPERAVLVAQAAHLGLTDHVRLHGFVSSEEKQALLNAAWLTVSPSQAEGWGLTVVEANAAGVPAVAFDVPGLRDSVVDGRTGWLIQNGRTLGDGIVDALRELEDPDVAEAVSRRCRSWAAKFSWDASADRFADVLVAEVDRVRRSGPERRTSSDLSVRVDARTTAAAELPGTAASRPVRLRRSDQWAVQGGELHLLLHGCDESSADSVLQRLGAGEPLLWNLATSTDLLIGAH